ncbi:aldo/keto reductase [Arthrobacter sulfonylureivorans]|uniref:aldo/keto reductase n=1 Tax=Arthrobacter sulfonylureivorans TaxID=2486855 RepID=UPI0039E482BD
MPGIAPTLELRGGVQLPMIGLGTWPMDNTESAVAVENALALGYRHIDTAENYENEAGVGEGIRRSGLEREDIFITSKFNKKWHGVEEVKHAFDAAASRLGVDYIDLFLVHWPNPHQNRYMEAAQGLKELLDAGKIRAFGTSNFKPAHLRRLLEAGLTPAVNQIQLDPEHVWSVEQEFHKQHGIVTASYSPLGRGGSFLSSPSVMDAAKKHQKTPSQVVLRWHIQQGLVPVPKSANQTRQQENLNIFDFELSEIEMDSITALDTGAPARLDSDEFGH